jgi:hypothetical protein
MTAFPSLVIPAQAGTSARKVTAGLAETPAGVYPERRRRRRRRAGATAVLFPVTPAQAGISARKVTAGLHEAPAFAGVPTCGGRHA